MENKSSKVNYLMSAAGQHKPTKVYTAGSNGYYFNVALNRNIGCQLENGIWRDSLNREWREDSDEFEYEQYQIIHKDTKVTYADNVKSGLQVREDGSVYFGIAYKDFNNEYVNENEE